MATHRPVRGARSPAPRVGRARAARGARRRGRAARGASRARPTTPPPRRRRSTPEGRRRAVPGSGGEPRARLPARRHGRAALRPAGRRHRRALRRRRRGARRVAAARASRRRSTCRATTIVRLAGAPRRGAGRDRQRRGDAGARRASARRSSRCRPGTVSGEATVEGSLDSLTVLVDRLAASAAGAEAGEDERLAQHTTPSLRALRAYLDGQAAFRASSYATASRHYERALGFDSTFALAALQLALAGDQLNDAGQLARGIAAAWPARAALSERDLAAARRAGGAALSGAVARRRAGHRVGAARRADAGPRGAWYQLGARLLRLGRAAGVDRARPPGARARRRARPQSPSTPAFAPRGAARRRAAGGSRRPAALRDSSSRSRRWRAGGRPSLAATRGAAPHPRHAPAARARDAARDRDHELFDGVALDDGADALGALRARATVPRSASTSRRPSTRSR